MAGETVAMTTAHGTSRPGNVRLIALLGLLSAFGPFSIDLYLPSLPTIAETFHRPPSQAALTVVAFLAGIAVGQLGYGPLSDRIGRRGPLIGGIILYIASSLGCAVAPSLAVLIALRFLQAVGACAGIIIPRAVVRDRWEGREVARVFSLLVTLTGIAPLVAPLAGGFILLFGGWRAIFAVQVLIGLLLGLWVLLDLEESRPEAAAVQARSESPISAYGGLLSQRAVWGFMVTAAFSQAFLLTYVANSPDLIIKTYHVPAQAYGLVFGTNAIGLIGGSQINHRLLRRFSAYRVLRAGNLAGFLVGVALTVDAVTGFGGLFGILVPLFLVVSSLGFTAPNAMAGAMAADPRRAGSTAALVGASQFAAGAGCAALAGFLHDGTARPMAGVMTGALLAAMLSLRLLVPRASRNDA